MGRVDVSKTSGCKFESCWACKISSKETQNMKKDDDDLFLINEEFSEEFYSFIDDPELFEDDWFYPENLFPFHEAPNSISDNTLKVNQR